MKGKREAEVRWWVPRRLGRVRDRMMWEAWILVWPAGSQIAAYNVQRSQTLVQAYVRSWSVKKA